MFGIFQKKEPDVPESNISKGLKFVAIGSTVVFAGLCFRDYRKYNGDAVDPCSDCAADHCDSCPVNAASTVSETVSETVAE